MQPGLITQHFPVARGVCDRITAEAKTVRGFQERVAATVYDRNQELLGPDRPAAGRLDIEPIVALAEHNVGDFDLVCFGFLDLQGFIDQVG